MGIRKIPAKIFKSCYQSKKMRKNNINLENQFKIL